MCDQKYQRDRSSFRNIQRGCQIRRICGKPLRITTKQAEDVVTPFSIFSAEKTFSAEQVQVSQHDLGGLCCFYGQVMSDQADYVWCHVSQAHVRRKNWSTNQLLLGYYRERSRETLTITLPKFLQRTCACDT